MTFLVIFSCPFVLVHEFAQNDLQSHFPRVIPSCKPKWSTKPFLRLHSFLSLPLLLAKPSLKGSLIFSRWQNIFVQESPFVHFQANIWHTFVKFPNFAQLLGLTFHVIPQRTMSLLWPWWLYEQISAKHPFSDTYPYFCPKASLLTPFLTYPLKLHFWCFPLILGKIRTYCH